MSQNMREDYENLRALGVKKRRALRQALVNAVRDAEQEQINNGLRYNRDEVRVAIVHGRHDLVLAIAHLDEISQSLRSIRRWLIAGVGLLLYMLIR